MDERPQSPEIRASDAERDECVVRLRDAVVAGRLNLEEFSERVGAAAQARTAGELARLTVDLPSRSSPAAVEADSVSHRAAFSQLTRQGAWELPARSSWRSLWGTILLDLRQARLGSADTELEIYNLFGTVTVIVPPGVRVDVSGGGLFASQVIQPPEFLPPAGAPRLRIRISGPGGTLHVRSTPARNWLQRVAGNMLGTGEDAGRLPRHGDPPADPRQAGESDPPADPRQAGESDPPAQA